MTVTVVYPAVDGNIVSSSNTYSTARTGTGTLSSGDTATVVTCGQRYINPTYYCYEAFFSFDTAFLADTNTVSSVTFSVVRDAASGQGRYFELRDYDFGASITTADWIAGANLGNYTLLSQMSIGSVIGPITFPSSAEFITATNLKTGTVHFVLSTDNLRTGTAPTGNEYVDFRCSEYDSARINDPYLTITWTDSGATTATIYPSVDGWVASNNSAYTTARSGSNLNSNSTDTYAPIGQNTTYTIYEGFFSFDTSSIDDTATVIGTTLSLNFGASINGSDVFELREYDFGTTITTADWIAGANLGNYTLLSQYNLTTGGWVTFPDTAAFRATTNMKTGTIHTVLAGSKTRIGTAPSGNEINSVYTSESTGTSNDPYLTVVYLPGVTAVSQAVVGQWDVDSLVARAVEAQWNVDSLVARAVEAQWDVMQLMGIRDVSAIWDVTALSGIRAVAAVWDVMQLTGVEASSALWDLEGKVSGEIAAIWDTEGRVWADLDARWDLEAYLVSELDAVWDVTIGTGTADMEADWNTDGWIVSDTVAVWDLDGAVSSELSALWDDMVYTDAFPCVMRWDTQIDIPPDNSMTYYILDAVSGEIVGDLPFTDVSMSWVLSGSGTFEGTLKLSDPEIVIRGGRNIRPGKTVIVADRGGVPIWSGIVWSKQYTGSDSTLRVTAGDFWTYVKRRLIFASYSKSFTDVLWAAEDLIKLAVSPGEFGPKRLTYQLSKPVPAADRAIKLTYAITDMKNVGEAIEELAEAPGDTGIDFICKQYWSAEGELTPFIKLGRPYVGHTFAETGMEFFFPGNVVSYEETVDASVLSNRVIAKGTDAGASTKYSVITRNDQLESYPRYDTGVSVDNTNFSIIQSKGEYTALRRATPTRVASLTVRADIEPSPLDMEIGDWFHLTVDDDQSSDEPEARAYRVGGMTYRPSEQVVEILPWVESDEYE